VWRWNRAVYDDAAGGHLRIEMRALPCGPTVADMTANAAFLIGLTLGLAPHVDEWLPRFTFGQARRNFYAAARDGLAAELLWPSARTPSPEPHAAASLLVSLLPVARAGLVDNGVAAAEADAQLGVVAERVARGVTGARWQRRTLERLGSGRTRREALAALLKRYLAAAATGRPVHEWEG
jgi:hypothetical protein